MIQELIAPVTTVVGHAMGASTGSLLDPVNDMIEKRNAGNGKNVVSSISNVLVDGMDAVGSVASGVRGAVGKGVHDAVSNVPIIGGLLGAATDAAGTLVDAAGGLWTEVQNGAQGISDAANAVGGVTTGAAVAESNYHKKLKADEQVDHDGESLGDQMKREGTISAVVGNVLSPVLTPIVQAAAPVVAPVAQAAGNAMRSALGVDENGDPIDSTAKTADYRAVTPDEATAYADAGVEDVQSGWLGFSQDGGDDAYTAVYGQPTSEASGYDFA